MMNKFKNLKLDESLSASISDTLKLDQLRESFSNINIINNMNRNTLNFGETEIGQESIIFKDEQFAVNSKGIKNTTTGEITYTISPEDIEMGEPIGNGASGSVYKAILKNKNIPIAVKSINIYDDNKRKQFKTDLKVLSENKCEFLVHFYGAFFQEGTVKILLEYMNLGSLENIVKIIKKKKIPQPCIPEPILATIVIQILNGLLYLYKKGHLIHRDIKPANILINSDGIVKLTDFGIAKNLDNSSNLSLTYVGTRNFMSPERIIGKEYSYSSDIWSLGLVIYELATGIFPYTENDYLMQIKKIVDDPEPSLPDNGLYSEDLINFVQGCLKKDPNERFSVTDLLYHNWIINNYDNEYDISKWLAKLFDYNLE